VHNGKVITPPLSSSILPGITRDSVIEICRELSIPVVESGIQRAALYVADEVFFTGTAAEITPIRSIDRITIGNGRRGEITGQLQERFFQITSGEREAPGPWLTYVSESAPVSFEGNGHSKEHVKEATAAVSSSTQGDEAGAFKAVMTE
jgi:branched-chain amino acid aminotransferase